MVENSAPRLDAAFAALADPTRRAILARLSEGELTVGALAEPFPISLAAVSKHIRVLSDAGLVTQRKRGRERHCRLETGPLAAAAGWLDDYRRFWSESFDRLDRVAREELPAAPPADEESPKPPRGA